MAPSQQVNRIFECNTIGGTETVRRILMRRNVTGVPIQKFALRQQTRFDLATAIVNAVIRGVEDCDRFEPLPTGGMIC